MLPFFEKRALKVPTGLGLLALAFPLLVGLARAPIR